MSPLSRLLSVIAAVACVGSVGCSKGGFPGPRDTVCPVSGQVFVKGRPAFEARVMASAVGKESTFVAVTDSEGRFRFTTYDPGDGLWPGQYAVRVKWPESLNSADPSTETDQLRGQYNDPKKPAFTVDIKEGPNELPPFDLK